MIVISFTFYKNFTIKANSDLIICSFVDVTILLSFLSNKKIENFFFQQPSTWWADQQVTQFYQVGLLLIIHDADNTCNRVMHLLKGETAFHFLDWFVSIFSFLIFTFSVCSFFFYFYSCEPPFKTFMPMPNGASVIKQETKQC